MAKKQKRMAVEPCYDEFESLGAGGSIAPMDAIIEALFKSNGGK